MTPSGLRTPTTPRSGAPSPKPTFDAETLRTYMKVLLQTTLQSATWPSSRERDRVRAWMKEIGERVKERMIGVLTSESRFAFAADTRLAIRRDTTERLVSYPLAYVICSDSPIDSTDGS